METGSLTASDIAARLDGRLEGDGARPIRRVMDAAAAEADAAAFVHPGREVPAGCGAGLLLLAPDAPAAGHPCVLRVAKPDLAAARLAQLLHPRQVPEPAIHPAASVDPSAALGEGVVVEAGAVVGAGCQIGAGSWLHPGVVLYPGVRVGAGTTIHAHTVIGCDGFGYVWDGSEHVKVPQLGTVRIGDGVEIGSCCSIDRGTFGATEIGDGCILDNQVQVGHNCRIGRFVVLCGQVGLAGSTVIEDGVVMAGKAGAGGHLTIGAGAQVGGGAGVTSDVAPGAKVAGHPAWDFQLEQRVKVLMRRMARKRGG